MLEALESFGGTWLHAPLSRHPLRQRPLHLRLPLQAVDRRADRDRRRDPDLHGRGHRGERPRPAHPLRPQDPSARWSSEDNLWTIEATRTDTGEAVRFTANFLWMCQGYYRHSEGYTPEWPGMESFKGRIVHPQTWPEDLDYAGKNVVVIGSGATAATLVPAIADECAHVTMLQRSPTYFIPGRNANDLADTLRELEIDENWIHEIVRRKILHDQAVFTRRAFEEPEVVKRGAARRRARLPRPGLRRGDALHAELPAVAAAHRLRARRRPVPGHPRRARPPSSPTRSSASPRRASC